MLTAEKLGQNYKQQKGIIKSAKQIFLDEDKIWRIPIYNITWIYSLFYRKRDIFIEEMGKTT